MITQWIPAGIQMAAVDERGSIVGRLIPLDEQIIRQAYKMPVNDSQKVREILLREKHLVMNRKRSERRRVAKRNGS